ELAVLLGQVAALVEHGEAHDVPVELDVADLADLEHPARGDPRPRAQRAEPEVDAGLALCTGLCGTRHGSSSDRVIALLSTNRGGAPGIPRRARSRRRAADAPGWVGSQSELTPPSARAQPA